MQITVTTVVAPGDSGEENVSFAILVTYLTALNLTGMRSQIQILLLGLIGMEAAGRAQAIPNQLNGQQSAYLKACRFAACRLVSLGRAGFPTREGVEPSHSSRCGSGVVSMMRTHGPRHTYGNAQKADYINQHFVAVKVDFDASPRLVAQLQRAQAILNRTGRDISAP